MDRRGIFQHAPTCTRARTTLQVHISIHGHTQVHRRGKQLAYMHVRVLASLHAHSCTSRQVRTASSLSYLGEPFLKYEQASSQPFELKAFCSCNSNL
eukprot:374035-Pelagomonas_calceolata.AAC.14